MRRNWLYPATTVLLAGMVLHGCDKDKGSDDSSSMLKCDWGLSPCEVEACQACDAMGGVDFVGTLSIPPIYSCHDAAGHRVDGYDGDDYCELPYCEEHVTILESKTAEVPGGTTPEDVLRVAEGLHTVSLTWLPDGTVGNIDIGLAGPTDLDLTVTYEDGEIRFVEREEIIPETDGVPDSDPGADCHATIEVDVTLQLVTADGGLNDRLAVSLTSTVDGSTPSPSIIDLSVPWSDLEGSLAVKEIAPEYTVAEALSLHTVFDEDGVQGDLETSVEARQAGSVGHTVLTIARW